MTLGWPRLHLRSVDSTNLRARELAGRGVPHGTLVTAGSQTAGRGRQGRAWTAPAGRALLCSLVVREPPRLLPLLAGVAVSDAAGREALVKWPNDVLIDGRKVAGILVEARPQEGWAVLGIGVNVAVRAEDFPPELRATAGGLGLEPSAIEGLLTRLLERLEVWLARPAEAVLEALRARDALAGKVVRWDGGTGTAAGGTGTAAGIDGFGRLLVAGDYGLLALDAGEVHLHHAVASPRASG